MTPDDNHQEPSPLADYAVYGAAGIQLAVVTVAGLLAGNALDGWLGWTPVLTIVGTALGFTGGILNLVRILGWYQRNRRP